MDCSDLVIKRIEIVDPERDIKPLLELQDEIVRTLEHEEFYFPSYYDEIAEALNGDNIILGVYDGDKLVGMSAAYTSALFFSRPVEEWTQLEGNKKMCHEFVVIDKDYRGRGLQARLMEETVREAKEMGYDALWCCAHPDNTPSVSNIKRTGYHRVASIVHNGWPRDVFCLKL